VRHLLTTHLVLIALAGLLTACGGGGGGGGGGTDPVEEVDPPVITAQPADEAVFVGETASFSVTATGEGTLGYAWQLSANGVGAWTNIPGASATTYTTPATALVDDGNEYRCVVSNAGGSVQSAAALLEVSTVPPWNHTIEIDGANDFTPDEDFQSTGEGLGFITWDADYVYIAMDSPLFVENSPDDWFVVYVGAPGGTTTGVAYGPQQPTLPFAAGFHTRWRVGVSEFSVLAWDGSSWVDSGWDLTDDWAAEENFFEMRIPRADIGDPSTVRLHLSLVKNVDMEERTTAGVPSTSFVNGLDPDYEAYFEFDFLGTDAPGTYAPLP